MGFRVTVNVTTTGVMTDKLASRCDPPCRNGGVCTPSNQCECLRGFEGVDCGKDVDECTRFAPCDTTRGECVNRPGWYECTCRAGYRLTVDGHQCIEVWRAQENPSLVFRGRGKKGIVVANPVSSLTSWAEGVVSFSSPRDQRRRRRRFGAKRLKRRNTKSVKSSSQLANGSWSPVTLRSFKRGDRGLKRRSALVLNSNTIPPRLL